ncbi:hypothetical protein D3C75_698880 [compost metagenome]
MYLCVTADDQHRIPDMQGRPQDCFRAAEQHPQASYRDFKQRRRGLIPCLDEWLHIGYQRHRIKCQYLASHGDIKVIRLLSAMHVQEFGERCGRT